MSNEMSFKVGATIEAPVAGVVKVEPKLLTDCSKCEGNIHMDVFFDGTNNMDIDRLEMVDIRCSRHAWGRTPTGTAWRPARTL
jgi:hypothetical protein